MKVYSRRLLLVSGILILISGLLPLGIGWYLANRTPSIALIMREGVPYQPITMFEQSAAVFSGYLVKPTYMLLSLLLIIFLWHQNANDLQILRWGLIFFLAGETFCAINYIFYQEDSALLEYWHSFGMVIGIALILLAFIEGLDSRLIRFTNPTEKCSLVSICNGCVKYKDIPCKLRQFFQFALAAFIAIAFIPATARPIEVSYNTTIWNTLYNYSHAIIHQLYEIRFCPWAAILLLASALLTLLIGKEKWMAVGKLLFSLGIGYLSFSFLRMVLLDSFQTNMVWFVFWEELTELVLILGIAFFLWIFRGQFFGKVLKTSKS